LVALAIVTLALALVLRVNLVALPLFLLAAGYLVAELSGHCAAVSVIAYAAGLIVVCELIYWSQAIPGALEVDRKISEYRLLALISIAAFSALLSLIALSASFLQIPAAIAAVVLGAAASVALLGLALVAARSSHAVAKGRRRSKS
jgi:surface polysaccharide O-acyltransferase-like enzyme